MPAVRTTRTSRETGLSSRGDTPIGAGRGQAQVCGVPALRAVRPTPQSLQRHVRAVPEAQDLKVEYCGLPAGETVRCDDEPAILSKRRQHRLSIIGYDTAKKSVVVKFDD